jgi:hypothetical protein
MVRLSNMDADNVDTSEEIEHIAKRGNTAAQWLIDAWAWVFFAINTSLTASIMYKIMSVAYLSLPSLYSRIRY